MESKIRIFNWLPRIVCILAILFVSLFALDSFSPGLTIWQQLGAFFMHLIPSFVLLAFLIVAWKRELIGAIIFILIGIAISVLVYNINYSRLHSVGKSLVIVVAIAIPFVVVGILFLISYLLKKKNSAEPPINSTL
jgi:hypothetical protein